MLPASHQHRSTARACSPSLGGKRSVSLPMKGRQNSPTLAGVVRGRAVARSLVSRIQTFLDNNGDFTLVVNILRVRTSYNFHIGRMCPNYCFILLSHRRLQQILYSAYAEERRLQQRSVLSLSSLSVNSLFTCFKGAAVIAVSLCTGRC